MDSLPSKEGFWLPKGRIGFAIGYWKWWCRVRFGPDVSLLGAPSLTVILLSYRRQHNMDALVRSALRCTFVKKLIVSNNNPTVSITDWVHVKDDRLVLIDQVHDTGAVERYMIAAQESGTYFLSFDDDVFLTPEQIAILYSLQLQDPERVHGFFGQEVPFPYSIETVNYCIHSRETEVDIVNRCYLFTSDHVSKFQDLLNRLGIKTEQQIRKLSIADDVIVSFCSAYKPRIHNIGMFLDCPTASKPGVAQYQSHRFNDDRFQLYLRLKGLKDL